MLQNKNAVIYGAGGSLGGAVAKALAQAGVQAPDAMTLVLNKMKADTMLKKMPLMADIANVAVFLSSHMAAGITGVTVDVTCGTTAALNYRVSSLTDARNGQPLAS